MNRNDRRRLDPETTKRARAREKMARKLREKEMGVTKQQRWRKANPKKWRDIRRNADRRQVARRIELVQALKSIPCHDCGIQYPHYIMEYDHRPGEEKLNTISRFAGKSMESTLTEIAKCDVVCANCHKARGWRRKHDIY